MQKSQKPHWLTRPRRAAHVDHNLTTRWSTSWKVIKHRITDFHKPFQVTPYSSFNRESLTRARLFWFDCIKIWLPVVFGGVRSRDWQWHTSIVLFCFDTMIQKSWFLFLSSKNLKIYPWSIVSILKSWFLFHCFETRAEIWNDRLETDDSLPIFGPKSVDSNYWVQLSNSCLQVQTKQKSW